MKQRVASRVRWPMEPKVLLDDLADPPAPRPIRSFLHQKPAQCMQHLTTS